MRYTCRVGRAPDDVPRGIDAVCTRPSKTGRQEPMQVHHALGGAIPEKRMSGSIGSNAPTHLPAVGYRECSRLTGAAGVKIYDTLGAARPEQSVAQTRAATESDLLAAADAAGRRRV